MAHATDILPLTAIARAALALRRVEAAVMLDMSIKTLRAHRKAPQPRADYEASEAA